MLSPSDVHVASGQLQRPAWHWKLPAGPKRLRLFAAQSMWWVLSIGLVVALWELIAALQLIDPMILPPPHLFIAEIQMLIAALQLIDPMILPPPHLFIAEIQQQAQFLVPRVGVRRVGANFVALTAIVASLQRVVSGLALAFVSALVMGSLAFYIKPIGKLTLPTI